MFPVHRLITELIPCQWNMRKIPLVCSCGIINNEINDSNFNFSTFQSLVSRFPVPRAIHGKHESASQRDTKKDASLYERSSVVLVHTAAAFLGTGKTGSGVGTTGPALVEQADSESDEKQVSTIDLCFIMFHQFLQTLCTFSCGSDPEVLD